MGEQRAPGLGELRPVAPAVEQRGVELRLEPPDRSGERGLGHVRVPRRSGEGPVLCDEDEVAQRLEHGTTLARPRSPTTGP